MLSAQDLLFGALLPSAVAWGLWRLLRARCGAAGAALALAAGIAAGQWALRGWRGWWPREAADGLALAACVGVLASLVLDPRVPRAAPRAALRALLAGALFAVVFAGVLGRRYGWPLEHLVALGIGAGAAALWGAVADPPSVAPRGRWPAALELLPGALVAGCAALALGLSGSKLLAQLAGVAAAACAGLLAASSDASHARAARGAAAPLALSLGLLLGAGGLLASLPWEAGALLLSAAPLGRVAAAASGRRALSVAVALGCSVAAVLLAHGASPSWDEF